MALLMSPEQAPGDTIVAKFTVRTFEGDRAPSTYGFDTLEAAESFIVSTLGNLVNLYDSVTITEEVQVRGTDHIRSLVADAQKPKFIAIPWSDAEKADMGYGRGDRGYRTCLLCGRAINPKTAPMVHEVDGGGVLAPEALDYQDEAADLGWWSIGRTAPSASRLSTSAAPGASRTKRPHGRPHLMGVLMSPQTRTEETPP